MDTLHKATRVALSGIAAMMAGSAMAQTSQPNIIFFLVDDMGWQDTSLPFWSEQTPLNQRYHTPNMERLAQQGVMFTNAYSCPVSSPSRCSLISGSNAARHGVTNWIEGNNQNTNASGSSVTLPSWNWNGVQPELGTPAADKQNSYIITPLPQLLKKAGYLTVHCGKGNFGSANTRSSNPRNLGFDINIAGGYAGGPGSYQAQDNYGSAIQSIGGLEEYASQGIFLTEALTQEAIKRLDASRDNGKPFYLYMSHYAIHTPYQADTRFTGNYSGYYDSLLGATLSESEVNRAALLEGMDKSLGDLMNWLDSTNQAQNTIILFMSDNGGQGVSPRQGTLNRHPNYPSRGGKGSCYDGGVHEPMIVRWPGVVGEGTKNENRVMIEDFFPSILEMAGVEDYTTVQTVDGKSFVDILRDPSIKRDRVNIWHYPNRWGESADRAEGYGAWSAMMKGDYHLLYFWENQELRLYNIKEDIGEQTNLAKTMPELTQQLAQELTDSLVAYGAARPTLAGTTTPVPWPANAEQIPAAGDVMKVTQLGVELSTADGEKHLYTIQDARGPFYWTQGTQYDFPAIQVTLDKLTGDDAVKQQFYFMQGSDAEHLLIYTADGKPLNYTEGITRDGYSSTNTVMTDYVQYGAETQAYEFQCVKSDDEGYYGITVSDGSYISNRGSSHGAENNMGWVVMPYAGSHYSDSGTRYKFVDINYVEPEKPSALPQLTTDEEHPILYRIKNTRRTAQGKANYLVFQGVSKQLSLSTDTVGAGAFWFTGTETDGVMTVKIHAQGTDRLMGGEAVWTTSGKNWYIKEYVTEQGGTDATTGKKYEGVIIGATSAFNTGTNNTKSSSGCWYVGSSDTNMWLYGRNWDGSIFTFEAMPQEAVDTTFYTIGCSANKDFVASVTDSKVTIQTKIDNTPAQQWTMTPVGDYYQLINRAVGQALNDPTTGTTTSTTNVGTQLDVTSPDETSDAQLWSVVEQSNGTYNLINKLTDHTFNLDGGTPGDGVRVISWKSEPDGKNKTSAGRLWVIEEVTAPEDTPEEPEGYTYFQIQSAKSGARVIDVETQNPSAGRKVILYTDQHNNISQHWKVKRVGEYYMFLSRLGEWAINDPTEGDATATTNTGTQLNIVVPDTTQQSQLWEFVELASYPGWGNLINVRTQHTMNINGGTDADGTAIISYKSEPTSGNLTSLNRRWRLVGIADSVKVDTVRTDTVKARISDRPHIYIYTEGGKSITSKKEWTAATMVYVDEQDSIIEYNDLDIRARGNSTYGSGSIYKMPYRVRFDQPVKFLGEGRANARNWTLMANAFDKTMMRNALTAELSNFVGLPFAPGAKFVDLSMNGIYVGTYQISDHMEVGEGRLELPEGTGTDQSYFLECDGYAEHTVIRTATKNVPVRIHYPKDNLTTAQKTYVKTFMDDFEKRLFASTFKDPVKGYRAVVDSVSLADWYIADEVCANPDGFWSQYFYKKAGDARLYFGPMWDYDIAYANDNRKGDTSKQLMKDVAYELDHNGSWIVRMWQDPWFQNLICTRYQELVENGLQDYLLSKVDSLAQELDKTQQLNYKKYGYSNEVLRQRLYHNTYAEYVQDLKNFIYTRVPYLTTAFESLNTNVTAVSDVRGERKQSALYDLSGRRLPEGTTQHGVYIRGGKKYVK